MCNFKNLGCEDDFLESNKNYASEVEQTIENALASINSKDPSCGSDLQSKKITTIPSHVSKLINSYEITKIIT